MFNGARVSVWEDENILEMVWWLHNNVNVHLTAHVDTVEMVPFTLCVSYNKSQAQGFGMALPSDD